MNQVTLQVHAKTCGMETYSAVIGTPDNLELLYKKIVMHELLCAGIFPNAVNRGHHFCNLPTEVNSSGPVFLSLVYRLTLFLL